MMDILKQHSTVNSSILKIMVAVLFIILPFLGFYLGVKYQSSISQPDLTLISPARRPTPTPKQEVFDTSYWKTYTSSDNSFSFKYPENLVYFKYENGVFTFFDNENAMQNCQKKLQTQDCYKNLFSFNGFRAYSSSTYTQYLDEERKTGASLKFDKFIDNQNREWQTKYELGQVYNFDGIYHTNDKYYIVSFQIHNLETKSLINQILSTFKFL